MSRAGLKGTFREALCPGLSGEDQVFPARCKEDERIGEMKNGNAD